MTMTAATSSGGTWQLDVDRYPAFAFDLDGVITRTAVVHAAAWKRLFDEVLAVRAAGRAWQPFDADREYRAYVDGKPRRDGLRSFLAARGISIPEGQPGDGPEEDTIHGLAARKNAYVLERLAREGVEVQPDAGRLLERARRVGIALAVVTASENSAAILAAARLTDAFAVRVDGLDVERLGLRGKPAADSFMEAARRLGSEPIHVVVFEDAIAGVRAGRAGGFGLVVGVDRTGHPSALCDAGADVVVSSLDTLELTRPKSRGLPA